MPKASEVAAELRKVADALDKNPDAACEPPVVGFYCSSRQEFMTAARAMNRPFRKKISAYAPENPYIELVHSSDSILLVARAPQSVTCTMLEPAKPAVYRCDPLLSDDEVAELGGAA